MRTRPAAARASWSARLEPLRLQANGAWVTGTCSTRGIGMFAPSSRCGREITATCERHRLSLTRRPDHVMEKTMQHVKFSGSSDSAAPRGRSFSASTATRAPWRAFAPGARRYPCHRHQVRVRDPGLLFQIPAGEPMSSIRRRKSCCHFWNLSDGMAVACSSPRLRPVPHRCVQLCGVPVRTLHADDPAVGNPEPGHGSRAPVRDRAAAGNPHARVLQTSR